ASSALKGRYLVHADAKRVGDLLLRDSAVAALQREGTAQLGCILRVNRDVRAARAPTGTRVALCQTPSRAPLRPHGSNLLPGSSHTTISGARRPGGHRAVLPRCPDGARNHPSRHGVHFDGSRRLRGGRGESRSPHPVWRSAGEPWLALGDPFGSVLLEG